MRTSTNAVASCSTVSIACVCTESMLKAACANSSSTTMSSMGAIAITPSSAWFCQSSVSSADFLRRCQTRTTCATASAMTAVITITVTSARTSGEVNCRKMPFMALSALSMKCRCLRSGVQVRDQQTLHARDLVLQEQLALFQALHLNLIHVYVERQARNDLIQVAVLDAQLPQLLEVAKQLAVDIVLDLRHGVSAVAVLRVRRPPVTALATASLTNRPRGCHGAFNLY